MDARTLACPACGASLRIEDRFARVVICEYCGASALVTPEGLDPTGKRAQLLDAPSRFHIGAKGEARGRRFSVRGRIRYSYEDGFWDEWFLLDERGKGRWLQEDEGMYTLYEKKRITTEIPPFGTYRVGARYPIEQLTLFVTETRKARIAGAEGELRFRLLPGDEVGFVDGNAQGRLVSIEFGDEEIELCIGDPLEYEDVTLEGEAEA